MNCRKTDYIEKNQSHKDKFSNMAHLFHQGEVSTKVEFLGVKFVYGPFVFTKGV